MEESTHRPPPRCRPLPPHAVDSHEERVEAAHEAELARRLHVALAALPPEERAAVVSAYGYAEGAAGAAVELDLEVGDADAVARNGLQLLRAALDDLDAHGRPRD